jgi:hypothetical protein
MSIDQYLKMMVAGGLMIVALEFLFLATCFTVWLVALIHCIKHKHDSDRLMWVLLVCFLGPLGAVLYLAMGKPKLPPPMLGSVAVINGPATGGPAFDHLAMQDEKKRAQAIDEALRAMSSAKRRP